MAWLPPPAGRRSDSGVGHFQVRVQVGDRAGERFVPIDALVDTGSTYTWIPSDILEGLGVRPEEDYPFELADGRQVQYPVAWTQIKIGARARPTVVVFGEPRSETILGEVALETFGLGVDPVHHRLVSVPARL